MAFSDRIAAAHRLASELCDRAGPDPLVLAIPRGGVAMGQVIASELGGEFGIVLVRKLRAPLPDALPIGAIDEDGWSIVDDAACGALADRFFLEREKMEQLHALRLRRAYYTPWGVMPSPQGRCTIVVDDGLDSGATMIAAMHAVRERGPRRLLVAVAVASRASLERVASRADEALCLHMVETHRMTQALLGHFPRVSDAEVATLLAHPAEARPPRPPPAVERFVQATRRGLSALKSHSPG